MGDLRGAVYRGKERQGARRLSCPASEDVAHGGGAAAAGHDTPTPLASAVQPACLPACPPVLAALYADGFAIVAVKVSGHHTGAPFAPPGLPPVPADGRRAALEQELMRVRVEGGRIREIEVRTGDVQLGHCWRFPRALLSPEEGTGFGAGWWTRGRGGRETAAWRCYGQLEHLEPVATLQMPVPAMPAGSTPMQASSSSLLTQAAARPCLQVLPSEGAGPLALYRALGGEASPAP